MGKYYVLIYKPETSRVVYYSMYNSDYFGVDEFPDDMSTNNLTFKRDEALVTTRQFAESLNKRLVQFDIYSVEDALMLAVMKS